MTFRGPFQTYPFCSGSAARVYWKKKKKSNVLLCQSKYYVAVWNGMGSIQPYCNMIVLSPSAQKESYYS